MKNANKLRLMISVIATLIVINHAIRLFRTDDMLQASVMSIAAILLGVGLIVSVKKAATKK